MYYCLVDNSLKMSYLQIPADHRGHNISHYKRSNTYI